jgi:hypothetical protein
MIPTVILEGRLMLSNEDNYLDAMFRNDTAQDMAGSTDDEQQADHTGLCSGFQMLLTLA